MPNRIVIVGDGAMGTLSTVLLAGSTTRVTWWGYEPAYMQEIARERENPRYLPGVPIPRTVNVTGEDDAVADADLIVSAVPCQFVRSVFTRLRAHITSKTAVCSVTKGIENDTLLRPTEILADVLGPRPMVVLSGPCIAPEAARQCPTAVVAASTDAELAAYVQQRFATPTFRVYTNPDLVGVEVAGAAKNVIALAAGIIDGLEAGDNCKAALLTRGLVEITRLGMAMGARRAETFAGLAGLGDLVTTCISPVGRNRSTGERIGRGESLDDVQASTRSVIEGVATTRSVVALAQRCDVDMPITQGVHRVLFEGQSPRDAIRDLMTRQPKAEVV